MLVSEFDSFVQQTDQSSGLAHDARLDIAIYGLASEVGSVVAAIKKRLLAGSGDAAWNVADSEIVEELGDVIWYCFSLAKIANASKPINVFAHDIANLKRELSAGDERADHIARVLPKEHRAAFLEAASAFPRTTRGMEFEDYQNIAFLTARTQGRELAQVCLAVLWQLTAQLFRKRMPLLELELNRQLRDQPINDVLGEIAWHTSALASIFGLQLSEVAAANMNKVAKRWDKTRTPLHDEAYPVNEQLPRRFEIAFVSLGPGRSRMYRDGCRLGDDLTDNAYQEDGYRFHDVMHLANAAKLGWSPVLRSLMGRKRKSNPRTDEVEDGARARIVEEALIKAIHSEGERLASLRGDSSPGEPRRLFPTRGEIEFGFLKLIATFVADLEVTANRFPEWEEAIFEGFDVFDQLRREGQGTVTVDLNHRTLAFSPHIFLNLQGQVAGLGSANLEVPRQINEGVGCDVHTNYSIEAQKIAILDALGLSGDVDELQKCIELTSDPARNLVSVRSSGVVQKAMWRAGIVAFRTTTSKSGSRIQATALALAD